MKKLLLASFILLSVTALGHNASGSVPGAEESVKAIATVIPQIEICVGDSLLDFGILLPGEIHDTRKSGQGKAANIIVKGSGIAPIDVIGARVSIGCSPSVTLKESGGGEIEANLYIGKVQGTGQVDPTLKRVLDQSSRAEFDVDGLITKGATKTGNYSGEFTVYAQYDQAFPVKP